MKNIRLTLACLALSLAAPAAAGEPQMAAGAAPRPVVLELFVSQNCAACLDANAAMAELSGAGGVLPLTYDVDYWDYLGWRDTLAHPDFADRQRAYADRFGQPRVYTPQMIVDGREAGPGGDGGRIQADIKICREAAADAPVALTARREGGQIAIEIGAGAAPSEGADIWLVAYHPGHMTVEIGGGENRGRDFTVVNAVREVRLVGQWRGKAQSLRADAPGTAGYAILVQHRDTGPILAAAKGM